MLLVHHHKSASDPPPLGHPLRRYRLCWKRRRLLLVLGDGDRVRRGRRRGRGRGRQSRGRVRGVATPPGLGPRFERRGLGAGGRARAPRDGEAVPDAAELLVPAPTESRLSSPYECGRGANAPEVLEGQERPAPEVAARQERRGAGQPRRAGVAVALAAVAARRLEDDERVGRAAGDADGPQLAEVEGRRMLEHGAVAGERGLEPPEEARAPGFAALRRGGFALLRRGVVTLVSLLRLFKLPPRLRRLRDRQLMAEVSSTMSMLHSLMPALEATGLIPAMAMGGSPPPPAAPAGLTAAELDALPRAVGVDRPRFVDQEDSEEDGCPICLNDIAPDEEVMVLPCAHSFHTKCVSDWLKRKTLCPCCNSDVAKVVREDAGEGNARDAHRSDY